jgi:hypothetical protein
MTVDKRAVDTDALRALGKTLGHNSEVKRDAIHLATEVVHSAEVLQPGQRVRLTYRQGTTVRALKEGEDWQGIVDPFLDGPTKPYDKFIMILKPGTITTLRHVWEHPDFEPLEESEADYDDDCRGC